MLFNKDLVFIHIGKTGGISCSRYLLENLKQPIYNCHLSAESEIAQLPKAKGAIPLTDTHRHWTLEQSLNYIKGYNERGLDDFKIVVAVVRNPITLEYSFYNHMKKAHVRGQRGPAAKVILDMSDGPFSEFVKNAGYHVPGLTQDDFVRVNGAIPEKVNLVKFESIDRDFIDTVTPYLRPGASKQFVRSNTTHYGKDGNAKRNRDITDEALEAIYQKHQYMFDSGLYSIDEPFI